MSAAQRATRRCGARRKGRGGRHEPVEQQVPDLALALRKAEGAAQRVPLEQATISYDSSEYVDYEVRRALGGREITDRVVRTRRTRCIVVVTAEGIENRSAGDPMAVAWDE